MLLTDCNPNTPEDLRVYESAILDVANLEQIDLGGKLNLARWEIAEDVLEVLLDHTRYTYLQANVRRQIGVSDVVVTYPMKRWHALHTLEVVYRDAFNNQLDDRYQAKFNEYYELAKDARTSTMKYGIGLVATPLSQAPAPVVSSAAQAELLAAAYFVQITWVSAVGQEGVRSPAISIDSEAGKAPVVSAPAGAPVGATGFNVYMGLLPNTISLQNSVPVTLGQSFTLPETGLAQGRVPGNGQSPDLYIVGGPMLRRG
jgi:hypothetical protein